MNYNEGSKKDYVKLSNKYKIRLATLIALFVVSIFSNVLLTSYAYKEPISKAITPSISNADIQKASEFIKDIQKSLALIDYSESADVLKVELAAKIYDLANNEYDSVSVDAIATKLLTVISKSTNSVTGLISYLTGELSNLGSNLENTLSSLVVNYDERVQIMATTAGGASEAGIDYKVELNGYIYYATEKSNKWVVLVHPFMLNGKMIANSLAEVYLNMGYNVLAPDLRGFGKSEGSVAMGYLESLDIWDWLTYINDENNAYIGDRKAEQVIIHGISLGGATTLQTWTQAGFGRDLTTKNVIGLIDDCGYDSMTGIIKGMLTTGAGMELLAKIANLAGKEDLYDVIGEDNVKNLLQDVIKVGISDAEFDLKQNTFYSGPLGTRKKSNVPLFIIHGTSDTTVPYTISTSMVYPEANKAGLLYDFWQVQNQPHAFVIIGMEKTNYTNKIKNFITSVESKVPNNNNNNNNNNNSEIIEKEKEEKGFFEKIGDTIGGFFKSIANFFKKIFK